MPGMLQIESLVQLCALTILGYEKNKGKVVYLSTVNNAKFYQKIVPGDLLQMKTELLKYNRGIGIVLVKGMLKKSWSVKQNLTLFFLMI